MVLTVCSARASVDHTDLVVSIDAWEQPLKNVLIEISKQISWKVVVDEELLETTVSGTFKGIELGAFLKRSLKGENLIVLYDDASKRVDVQSFGSVPRSHAGVDDRPPDVAFYPQITQAGTEQNQQSRQEFLANPDSVEPLSGLTLGEIAAVHSADPVTYGFTDQHSQVIDPVSGMSLAEIALLPVPGKEYNEEYVQYAELVDPLTGRVLTEIITARTSEQRVYRESR
jgi:hypothetical protein